MKKIFIPIFFSLILTLVCCLISFNANVFSAVSANEYNLPSDISVNMPDGKKVDLSYNTLRFIVNKDLVIKLKSMGFDDEIICKYIFKDFDYKIQEMKEGAECLPTNSTYVVKNGMIQATKESQGRAIDQTQLYSKLVNSIAMNESAITVPMYIVPASVTYDEIQKYCTLRSAFETPITGANQEGRINNIGVALSQFNGKVIKSGEEVSFNNIVGDTTPERGYKLAKVIVNGKYEDDYGGGVCQAATTIYNAVLLAGLEVKEANPHSLKVGYVLGGFDAMVATGISDLVFKNNTDGDIILATFCNAEECGVRVFGVKNDLEIKRVSEKIEYDQEKFPNVASKYLSKLEYYENGKLKETKLLRNSSYYKKKHKTDE